MHRTTARFWGLFDQLPEAVQAIARKNFELLKTNPFHPSLHFKKIGSVWSVRAGINYRALAVQDGGDYVWVWIGEHDAYTRLIKRQQ